MTASPLRVVGPTALMGASAGSTDIAISQIESPFAADHPDLASENIRRLSPVDVGTTGSNEAITADGTFAGGILAARWMETPCTHISVTASIIARVSASALHRLPVEGLAGFGGFRGLGCYCSRRSTERLCSFVLLTGDIAAAFSKTHAMSS